MPIEIERNGLLNIFLGSSDSHEQSQKMAELPKLGLQPRDFCWLFLRANFQPLNVKKFFERFHRCGKDM